MKQVTEMAITALKNHNGNIEKALPNFIRAVQTAKLIDDLARAFLRSIAARGSGQQAVEILGRNAGPTQRDGSIKVKAHDVRQHRRRTTAEKDAAERAVLASAEAVFELQVEGRAIGNIAMGELAALKRHLVHDATHKLMLGAEQVRNAIIAELIEQHCIVQDQLMRVREAVDAKTLARFIKQAEQDTPRRIEEAMRRAAEAMGQKEIAA